MKDRVRGIQPSLSDVSEGVLFKMRGCVINYHSNEKYLFLQILIVCMNSVSSFASSLSDFAERCDFCGDDEGNVCCDRELLRCKYFSNRAICLQSAGEIS